MSFQGPAEYLHSAQQFQQYLEAYKKAGLEFDVGQNSQYTLDCVRSLGTQWEVWVKENPAGTLEQFLEMLRDAPRIPPLYKRALERWVQGDRVRALEMITACSNSTRLVHRSYLLVWVQFVFLFSAIFLTLVGVCWYLVPVFSELQLRSFIAQGPAFKSLLWVNSLLPVWMILIPTFFVLLLCTRSKISKIIFRDWKKTTEVSFALAETQDSSTVPLKVSIMTQSAVLICGAFMMLVAYWIYGTTIELMIYIMRAGENSA